MHSVLFALLDASWQRSLYEGLIPAYIYNSRFLKLVRATLILELGTAAGFRVTRQQQAWVERAVNHLLSLLNWMLSDQIHLHFCSTHSYSKLWGAT